MRYNITLSTNPWIANRDIRFPKGKTSVTLIGGLELGDAQKKLAQFYAEDYDEFIEDTTDFMSYEYDSRYYRIEEDEEDGL